MHLAERLVQVEEPRVPQLEPRVWARILAEVALDPDEVDCVRRVLAFSVALFAAGELYVAEGGERLPLLDARVDHDCGQAPAEPLSQTVDGRRPGSWWPVLACCAGVVPK